MIIIDEKEIFILAETLVIGTEYEKDLIEIRLRHMPPEQRNQVLELKKTMRKPRKTA